MLTEGPITEQSGVIGVGAFQSGMALVMGVESERGFFPPGEGGGVSLGTVGGSAVSGEVGGVWNMSWCGPVGPWPSLLEKLPMTLCERGSTQKWPSSLVPQSGQSSEGAP